MASLTFLLVGAAFEWSAQRRGVSARKIGASILLGIAKTIIIWLEEAYELCKIYLLSQSIGLYSSKISHLSRSMIPDHIPKTSATFSTCWHQRRDCLTDCLLCIGSVSRQGPAGDTYEPLISSQNQFLWRFETWLKNGRQALASPAFIYRKQPPILNVRLNREKSCDENKSSIPSRSSEGIDIGIEDDSHLNLSASSPPECHATAEPKKSFILVYSLIGKEQNLWQFDLDGQTPINDQDLFQRLNQAYQKAKLRSISWQGLLQRCTPEFLIRQHFDYIRLQTVPGTSTTVSFRVLKYRDFPPESEKDNYQPCGRDLAKRPPPSSTILEYYYKRHCSKAVPFWVVDRIPKKLHHKLDICGDKPIMGWALLMEERISGRFVLIWYLTLLMGLLSVTLAMIQTALATSCVFRTTVMSMLQTLMSISQPLMSIFLFSINCFLLLHSFRQLPTSHNRQKCTSLPLLGGLDDAANNIVRTDGNGNELMNSDPEAQILNDRAKTAERSRIHSLWRWCKQRLGGKDDGDDDREKGFDGNGNDNSENHDEFILVCVQAGSEPLPRLVQLPARQFSNDQAFFKNLKKIVSRGRQCCWIGFLFCCGIWRIMGIHYVKFELFPDGHVQILEKPKQPPLSFSSSYRPTEGTTNTTLNTTDWLDSPALLFFYRNPSALAGSSFIMQRVTRKIDGKLGCTGSPKIGYGMQLEMGSDTCRLNVLRFVLVFLSICFGLGWSLRTHDIQSGFAIGGGLAIVAGSFVEMCKGQESEIS